MPYVATLLCRYDICLLDATPRHAQDAIVCSYVFAAMSIVFFTMPRFSASFVRLPFYRLFTRFSLMFTATLDMMPLRYARARYG